MKLWIAKLLRKAANRLDPDNPQFVDGTISAHGDGLAHITPGQIVTDRRTIPMPISAHAVANARDSFDVAKVVEELGAAGLTAEPAAIVVPGYGGVRVNVPDGEYHVGPSGGMTNVGPADGQQFVVRWLAAGTASASLVDVVPSVRAAGDLINDHQAGLAISTRH